ncbi:AAA family ATPase [Jiangella asiatica]|uniref:Phosphotransferase n=1 Tax=Jiangella asiatica TaxID=2530372 RepID=A0A4R5DM97_9ACTN|nr:AAA family ATPase [Jiangella asiatica]TDE11793.1 phosphotransferase [Jiangella asiatica]
MSSVYLITGVMAAGKSTVAQALAERLPTAAHVRGDAFRKAIVSGRAEPVPGDVEGEAQRLLRYRIAAGVADQYAAAGITAVVQDVIIGPELADVVEVVRTRPLYVVVLAPHPEAVAEREEARVKTGYGAWTIADLDGALRHETPRIGLWLDTSRMTPAETVDAILAGRAEAEV